MPKPQEKQKLSQEERNKLLDESMQRAYAKVSGEMPDVQRVSVTPSTSTFLTRLMMPRGANAVTNPFTGNITYNPDMLQGVDDNERQQILAHELTHVRQTQNQPWYKILGNIMSQNVTGEDKPPAGVSSILNDPYYWRPNEMEAYQAERDRAQRLNYPHYADPMTGGQDINLPAEKKQPGIDTGPRMGSPLFMR